MALAPHTIHAASGSRRRVRRLGRGHGSGRGTTAGRGTKGQRARTGGRSRTAIRAFKRALQKIPKSRGFTSIYPHAETVTLATLERLCDAGTIVTPTLLQELHAIHRADRGVKIVATGTVTKQLTIQNCAASTSAREAIEKAGGKIED